MSEQRPSYDELLARVAQLEQQQQRQASAQASALPETAGHQRAVFDAIPDAQLIMDTSGRIIEVNQAAVTSYGYSREELLTMTLHDLGPPDLADQMSDHARRVSQRAATQFEWRHRRKDGSEFPVEINTLPLTVAGRRCMLASVRDLTERKLAEAALRNSEERFRQVAESAGDWIWEVDATGLYTYSSPAVEELLGFKPEELVGKKRFFEFFHPDDREALTAGALVAFAAKQPLGEFPNRNVHKNGQAVWLATTGFPLLDDEGNLLGYRGADTDITARVLADAYRELGREVLQILTEPGELRDSVQRVLAVVKTRTGVDAVGLRLQDGDDFPFYSQDGFSPEFVRTENALLARNRDGKVCRDQDGNVSLECLCGLVIAGKTDPAKPLFTRGGSAWTNDSGTLLGIPPGEDPRIHPRNRCVREGYASVVLVPIRNQERVVGMLQLADRRQGRFSLEAVELLEGIAAHLDAGLVRKQAEEALRQSEGEFRSLAEAMPQIVWATRKDGWNVYFNQRWVDYTGLTLEESYGHGWNTPFHPEDRQRAWDAWQNAMNHGAPYSLECRLRRADGEYRWWLVRGVPLLDQNGEILKWFGTCTDIDDIKVAEEALRKGEAELRAVIDASPFPVAIVDVNGDDILFWSRSAQVLFGHAAPTVLEWYRLAYPDPSYRRDAIDRWTPLMEKARASGGTVNTGEYQITCSDGRVRRCELYASFLPDRLIVTFDDVTDRKRALDARDASETRYRRLFEAAKDGILILDAVTGMIVDVNPFLTTLTGYSHEEFLGKHLWEIGPFRDVAASKDSFAELQSRDYVRYEDLPLQTHDGRRIDVEFVSNVYFVDNQRVIQCNVRDISERRQAEKVREKLEEQLRVSQKMEAIGGLAGGIAHDFNNLLSVILSYTGFAMEGVREGDPLKDDLLEVKLAGERGAALTRQLLAFSRKQMLQPVPLSLNQVAADVENMLRRILGEDIDLVQVLAPDLGVTRADQGQMEQVLMNLVVNARDAMPAGGRLTIETSNVDLNDEYAAQQVAVKPGPYIQLVVTDTGCGMDAQTKARIFEPFFTTKEKSKGTGLGLSMVYGIVKQSGGNIWVYSELGKGTAFKVYLPRDLTATAAASGPQRVPNLVRGTETILLVEDEEALRKVAERMLGAVGYTVLAAANGGEALLTCSQYPGDLHLLLTDVVMPRMSGRVLADELVKIRPTLKVLYMSGYTDDAIVHHGVLDAGTHFLGKPFSASELTAKVRETLDEDLARPESAALREAEVDGDTTT